MMETDHIYYAYSCKGCKRVVTKLQVLAMMRGDAARICSCGGGQISPCDISGTDWLLPRVWKLALYKILGKLAPPPVDTRPVAVDPMGTKSA